MAVSQDTLGQPSMFVRHPIAALWKQEQDHQPRLSFDGHRRIIDEVRETLRTRGYP